MHTDLCRFIS